MAHHVVIIKHPSNDEEYDCGGVNMDIIIDAVGAYSYAPSYLAPALTWAEYGTGTAPTSGQPGVTYTNNDLSLEWISSTTDLGTIISALQVADDPANDALISALQTVLNG